MKTDYQKQGRDFLKVTNTKLKVEFVENGIHFDDGKYRDIFKATFKRGNKQFSLRFGQSLNDSTGTGDNIPSVYDILSCIVKNDDGTFEEFCSAFGYDDLKLSAYPKIKKIYNACKKEYINVCEMWDDGEIELLQEIQ